MDHIWSKMKAFITFAFLSLAALPGFLVAQVQPVNPKFSLKLSERKPENYKGKHIWLVIEMTNTSDEVLDCSSFVETNTHDHGFLYAVRGPDGNPAEKVLPSHPEIVGIVGGNYPCSIDPGKSKKSDIAINEIYHFDQPGDYTIQVSRLAEKRPDEGYINSNTIVVTVLPKPENAEPK